MKMQEIAQAVKALPGNYAKGSIKTSDRDEFEIIAELTDGKRVKYDNTKKEWTELTTH